MGLLDRLEKEIKEHPLKNENIEKKIQFLNGIAYFISIDNVITNNEREYFLNLIDLLNCNEAKEDLLLFLENPDEQEFKNTFSYLHQNELMITYFLEVFFTIQNENLNEFENRFIDIILSMYEYPKMQIDTIFEFVKIAQTKDDKRIIEFFKEIQNEKKIYEEYLVYLANFYQLNFKTKNDLNEIVKNGYILKREDIEKLIDNLVEARKVCREHKSQQQQSQGNIWIGFKENFVSFGQFGPVWGQERKDEKFSPWNGLNNKLCDVIIALSKDKDFFN